MPRPPPGPVRTRSAAGDADSSQRSVSATVPVVPRALMWHSGALPQFLPQLARRDHQHRRTNQQVSEYQRVSKHAAPVTGGQVVAGSNPVSLPESQRPARARSMKRPRLGPASRSPTSSNPQPVRLPQAGMESATGSAPWPPFLCSAPASYVTGAALRCDGGLVPTL
jgi:hypothetical protein